MTELQWLIKMLTQQKLPASLKDLFIERIGEVEQSLSKAPPPPRPAAVMAQAPSTQRILDEMNIDPVAPTLPPRIIVPQEVVTSKGAAGSYTKGPRKF